MSSRELPKASGTALPTDSKELAKQLKLLSNDNGSNYNNNRRLKQDIQSQTIELKLMSFEDCPVIAPSDYKRRIDRYKDELRMLVFQFKFRDNNRV